jgi:dienelactone hydrolase
MIRSLLLLALLASAAAGASPELRTGTVTFEPAANEAELPARFRLQAHQFDFRQTPLETAATKIELFEVTFPSPVATPHENNNTVHCEYFRPRAANEQQQPAVVVLHILGGDFPLSRLFCRTLAHNGVAALFVKLPYYGPRRQPDTPARMVSLDPAETVKGMTQGVLDIRRARAWLAAQEEVDPDQLGIFGVSLGGITSALAASAEPRFTKVCMLLAGGDIARVGWSSPELKGVREQWLARGKTYEEFVEVMREIDPVTYAEHVRGRRMLMLNASYDEVIPRECTESLWRALGEPEIVWWDAGHYSAARFMLDGLARVTRFFQPMRD